MLHSGSCVRLQELYASSAAFAALRGRWVRVDLGGCSLRWRWQPIGSATVWCAKTLSFQAPILRNGRITIANACRGGEIKKVCPDYACWQKPSIFWGCPCLSNNQTWCHQVLDWISEIWSSSHGIYRSLLGKSRQNTTHQLWNAKHSEILKPTTRWNRMLLFF